MNLIIADLEGKNGSDFFYTKFQSCHRCLNLRMYFDLDFRNERKVLEPGKFFSCGKSFTVEKYLVGKVLKIQIRFQNDNFIAGKKFERKAFSASISKYLHTYLKQLNYKIFFVFNRPNYSQFSYFLCQRLRSFKSSHVSIEKSIMEWIFRFYCYCHGLQNLHFRYVPN